MWSKEVFSLVRSPIVSVHRIRAGPPVCPDEIGFYPAAQRRGRTIQ